MKLALVQVLREASPEAQLKLMRAHPELAGKAMVSKTLTAESTNEQGKAGLTDCTAEEFAKIQQLNAAYNAKFGFPFMLAVRGPRGTGLNKAEIIATFERRLDNHPDYEHGREPAQHPSRGRDPAGRQVRPCARTGQPGVGLGRAPGRSTATPVMPNAANSPSPT